MDPFLDLNIFTSFIDITKHTKLPKNAFDLISNPQLEKWLTLLLNKLQVGDQPKILGTLSPGAYVFGRVYVAPTATIEPGAFIKGPTYIGEGSEVRHGAYIRGSVYIGSNCVVGHATEVKEACFLNEAKAGHFAYVGNSILGHNCNLGAGTKLANLKLNKTLVKYLHPESNKIESSGLKKFGAIVGDFCQTGCNSVLSPGTLLLPNTAVGPCKHFHGTQRKPLI